jgi:O-antigen/teichoic acid export membrane protein
MNAPLTHRPGVRSLKLNTLFAVGGTGLFQACQFGVVVLLAKIALPEVLGQVLYSLAVATPLIVFCSLELRGALVADTAAEFTFGTYRALRRATMAVAGFALVGLAAWDARREPSFVYAIIFVGMGGGKIILHLAEANWGLLQKRERLDLLAGSVALRGIVMMVAFGVIVPLAVLWGRSGETPVNRSAEGAALAVSVYVAISALLLFVYDRPCVAARPDHDPSWNWPGVWRLARQTFPLGLVVLMLHLCNSIPQLVIGGETNGKAAVGRFGALALVTLAGNLLVFQSAYAAANRLSAYYQTDLPAFLRLLGKLLALAVGVGAVALAVTFGCGQWLLRVLFRPEYVEHYAAFQVIVVAQCLALLTSVLGVTVTQMRLFWLQVPAQVVVLASTGVAALLLIHSATDLVAGGAWTMLVRSIVHLALYVGCAAVGLALRSRLRQRPPVAVEGPPAATSELP